MKKHILAASVALFLSACGGGGVITVPVTPPVVVPPKPFESTPLLLPDLKTKYQSLCGVGVNVQNAIPVDLNGDNKKDLLLNLWCFFKEGQDPFSEVVNGLVALIQNPDGSFSDKTLEVFGTNMPSIQGQGYGYAVADFNGDGKPDILIATNKEDGRRPIDGGASNMFSYLKAIMSSPTGYKIENLGEPAWGDDIRLHKEANGEIFAIVLPAGYSYVQKWKYKNGWQVSTEYKDWLEKNPVFVNSANNNIIDNQTVLLNRVIKQYSYTIELWNRPNGTWTKVSEQPLLTVKDLTVKDSYTGKTSTSQYTTFEGKDYLNYGFVYEGCSLKMTPTSPTISLRTFLGDEIVGGYTGQVVNGDYRPPTLKIFPIEISGTNLVIKPSILSEKLDANFYHIECRDLNNDGYDDILVRTSGTPIFYINNQAGTFKRLKSGVLPYDVAPRGSSILFTDLNGDSINDLLYFPLDRWQFNSDWNSGTVTNVQYPLFKGLRNITPEDLVQ